MFSNNYFAQPAAKAAGFVQNVPFAQQQVGQGVQQQQQQRAVTQLPRHAHSMQQQKQQQLANQGGFTRPQEVAKPAQETLTFVDVKGNPQTIPLQYNPHEQGQVVQCCDPWNEHVYYLPLHLLDRTTGLETHVHNKTGRRAQVCMKHQQQRCNMRDKCLQIHGDWNMIEQLRQLYISDKKHYVSEVSAVDVSDNRNDVLLFKYSEIEPGVAKDNYRRCGGKAKSFVLCSSFITRGLCPNGTQCTAIHVSRDRYLKAKTNHAGQPHHHHQAQPPQQQQQARAVPRGMQAPATAMRWEPTVFDAAAAARRAQQEQRVQPVQQQQQAPVVTDMVLRAMYEYENSTPASAVAQQQHQHQQQFNVQPMRPQQPSMIHRTSTDELRVVSNVTSVTTIGSDDMNSDSNSSHGTSWMVSNDSNECSGTSSPSLDFGPTLSRLSTSQHSEVTTFTPGNFAAAESMVRHPVPQVIVSETVPTVVPPPQLQFTAKQAAVCEEKAADLEEENEDIRRLLEDLNLDLE